MVQPEDRFARLKTDPRFRRPKQKQLKVEIDERFRDVLESEEFGGKGQGKGKGKAADVKLDKRGRPLTGSHHQDQLKRFYRLRSASPSGSTSGAQEGFVDYARGQGYLSSSGSESEEEDSEASEEELEIGGKKRVKVRPEYDDSDEEDGSSEPSGSHLEVDLSEDEEGVSAFPPETMSNIDEEEEEEEDDGPTTEPTTRIAAVNLDWDNLRAADLYAVFNSFLKESGRKVKGGKDMAGQGRLVSVKIYPSEFGKERMKREEMEGPGGGVFLMKPGEKKGKGKRKGGILLQEELESDEESGSEADEEDEEAEGVDIVDEEDDSDHEEEELDEGDDDSEEDVSDDDDGLPAEGKANGLEVMSDLSSEAGSEDIDMDQLRQYQLERLRYYYAIATFSTVAAAEHIMEECNGTEFERTANVLDLTYVPDGMDFTEDDIHDEATKEPKGYKGTDFVTDALRHSKVKLTWDQDDPNRSKLTRKAMTREEIEEQDFKNLIAGSDDSGSSSDEGDEEEAEGAERSTSKAAQKALADTKSKKAKTKERKEKLRSLLLAANEDDGDIWGKAGLSGLADMQDTDEKPGKEMEITFRPALAAGMEVEDDNLTSLERYQLRMKEKKARKKEKLEMRRGMKEGDAKDDEGAPDVDAKGDKEEDDFFGGESGEEDTPVATKSAVKTKSRSVDEAGKVDNTAIKQPRSAPKPLDVTPADSEVHPELQEGDDKAHFSMKDIIRSEKGEGKRKRKRASQAKKEAKAEALGRTRETELGKEGWKIDVADPRFKVLHEEPEFAIDPSNPHFTKTKAMKDLLAERARLRQGKNKDDLPPTEKPAINPAQKSTADMGGTKERDLGALVQSVKRRMEQNGGQVKSGRKRHRK